MSGNKLKYLAILTVRNEAGFLLEWLAHHRAVGFTDFLVFSNDCQDGTDTMLDHLAGLGQLTHIRNEGPYEKRGIQFTALRLANDLELVRQADWIMHLDIDEFVNIHVGDHTLPALIAALPKASAITVTWRLFGNDGIKAYEDRPVTEVFTACAPEIIHWPWRAAMFKTLFRNDGIYRKLGVHRPRDPDKERLNGARWFDCAGRELSADFKTNRVFSDYGRPLFRLAQLNHYVLGAMESYVLKSSRGRSNFADRLLMDYWIERNLNTDRDTSVQQISEQSAPLLRALKSDETLAQLHETGVQWRKDQFDALLRDKQYRNLYYRLLMAQPSRPLDAQDARFLRGHAHNDGPGGANPT